MAAVTRRRASAVPLAAALLTAALLPSTLLMACSSTSPQAAPASTPASASPTVAPSTPATPSVPITPAAPATTRPRSTSPVQTAASAPRAAQPSLPAPTVPNVPVGSGRIVVLNPGHNGGNEAATAQINQPVPSGFGKTRACDTTGTNTDAGYPEHAFNWDVTLRVKALLEARGVPVLLTRPNDTGVGPCIDVRSAIGNRSDVAAFVSIHADGAPSSGHGFHICEDSRQPAGPTIAAQSHALTVAVHDALVNGSGLSTSTYLGSNGYYPRDDLAGLNLALRPATFIELGNMRNAGDASLQSAASGRQRMAVAIATGILAFLGR